MFTKSAGDRGVCALVGEITGEKAHERLERGEESLGAPFAIGIAAAAASGRSITMKNEKIGSRSFSVDTYKARLITVA